MMVYSITVLQGDNMITTKVTRKHQATIPLKIRKLLGLHANDYVRFEIIDGKVVLGKVEPFDFEYHKALENTLSEWSSKEDEEAYRDL
jgi:AbrB family looped-hinge helix DNA binding protein